ncbi:helix-turn-helix transcriptional regulator [Nostoc sp. T09]|uniref:LuxR C-terminal-related transcriptional regulator n=1 Tax=Nostoc sp. T09 TaxID=1932621 RepID=UPI000A38147F|nr:LuxR C-terminal-related transcriptional regulator [Nostoc sp. T09]OUL28428.1 helix-turn-helix transcriptional regulator [Nostoc sp. T09]
MRNSLQLLFEAINQAQNEQELRSRVVPKLSEYFTTKKCGVFFFDQLLFADSKLQKILEVGLSIEHNPVVRYLVERHAPVHEALVATPNVWRMICPRPDHWHVMAGPIVSNGQLVGVVGFTREQTMTAFDAQDLADLSALCLHLSIWNATVRSRYQPLKSDRLTSRELEIAELVALGYTNAEIGHKLWITENSVKQALKRMFRKLEVSSRAEMVAQLAKVTIALQGDAIQLQGDALI